MTQQEIMNYRADFPLLRESKVAYLDNAATSQRPDCVLDAQRKFYETHNANPLRGLYQLGMDATEDYAAARETVRRFLNAKSDSEIIFTRNATESLNLAAYTLSEYLLKPGDEIIVSIMEHHSNILPWQHAAKRYGATVKYLECDMDGTIPAERLESMITDRTKIAAITQISNVLGCRNDLKTFAEICHRHGVILVGDGAQSVPHIAVDVQDLGVDFLSFSGHKMLAPMGIGALYGKKELLEKLPPFLTGGEMIDSVTEQDAVWAPVPEKFEAGTQDAAGEHGRHGVEQVHFAPQHADAHGAHGLVRAKGKEVGAQIGHIDRHVRQRLRAVDDQIAAVLVHELAEILDRVLDAQHVRHLTHGQDFGLGAHLGQNLLGGELTGLGGVEVDELGAGFAADLLPRD